MERKGFLGGSDAKRILDGDWFTLWQEKTGRVEPENLDHQFNVQLGVHTEIFHLQWLNKYHGFATYGRGMAAEMPGYRFIRASVDGWCNTHDTFVEVKHTNARATRDSMVDWYQPQIAHYCNVCNVGHGWLSYIAGNAAPDFFKIEPSKAYCEALLEAEKAFWWHVENDQAPEMGNEGEGMVEAAIAASKDVRIDDMRVVAMDGNNLWADHAAKYIANKGSAATFEAAKKALKDLVEADVRIAAGHGILIKRNKAGNLAITESKS